MTIKVIPPPQGLSDTYLKYLKPQSKRYEIADKLCSGLRVRVGTTGKKSFVWYYKDSDTHQLKMHTLGRYGKEENQLTLSKARKALYKIKRKRAKGKTAILNPVKTIAELCNVFYEKRILYRVPVPEPVLVIINHDIKQFIGNKNISTFSIADVNHCFNITNKYGTPTHAHFVSTLLIQLFEFAIKTGVYRSFIDLYSL